MASISTVTTVQLTADEFFTTTVRYRRRPVADFIVHAVIRDDDVLHVRGRTQRDGYLNVMLRFNEEADHESINEIAEALRHVLPYGEWVNICF